MPHRLDENTLINPVVLREFIRAAQAEQGDGRHCAVLQRSNREFLDHNPHSPELPDHQMMFAQDVLTMLNDELNHSGAWVIVFTHPRITIPKADSAYTRFLTIWIDGDGDPHVATEWQEGESEQLEFHDVMADGLVSWVSKCENAWVAYHEMVADSMAPAENQLIKAAKGQRPAPQRMH